MNQKFLLLSMVAGVSLALIGCVGDAIMFFKPWASCNYDTVSAACAATDLESLFFTAFFCLFLVGLSIVVLSFVYRLKKITQRPYSDQ